ncbi:uncharacterized protein [Cicer arietinum]|uniref:uncharacterized protein n=1 Tax=Cicer arietinum TaxID=3827 RepID=UPI003CC6B96A
MCDDGVENSLHVSFLCSNGRNCWHQCNFRDMVQATTIRANFAAILIFTLLQRLGHTQVAWMAMTVWSLWQQQNNRLWHNIIENPMQVINYNMRLLEEWKLAQNLQQRQMSDNIINSPIIWLKFNDGRYKCNVGVSFSNISDRVGISICIRDDGGHFVLAKTEWSHSSAQ